MKTVVFGRFLSILLCLCILTGSVSCVRALYTREVLQVTATKIDATLLQEVKALAAEIDAMPTTGALRNGKVSLSGFTQSATGSEDITGLEGKHYLIRSEGSGYYALDGSWTGTNGNLPIKSVSVSGYSVISGVNPAMAFSFHSRGVSSNGMPLYVLRLNNGRNISIGTQYSDWPELYYVKANTITDLATAPTVRMDHPTGASWLRFSNSEGTHGLRQSSDLTGFRWKNNAAGDNDYQGNALELYRLWSTRELITAIHDMRGYLEVPEFYDEQVLAEFLLCMRQAIDLFNCYNPVPKALVEPYDFIQETLDQQEAALRGFASRLSFEVEDPPAEQLNATTKIHQLPTACGYVIQTRQGKIIIVDGGEQTNNAEGTYLFNYLQKITGDATPHIDAWFLTHPHGDHYGVILEFAKTYASQVITAWEAFS